MVQNLIYDVGLHKGEDSEYYLKKGFKVIAFEADPDLVNSCSRKFESEISNGSMIIIEGAIVDLNSKSLKDGFVSFHKNTSKSVWGTIDTEWDNRNKKLGAQSELIRVKAVNFLECLEKFGIPYYMKIDIEGLDHVCLEALKKFKEKPPFLSEKRSYLKLIKEIKLLSSLGYNSFNVVQQQGISRQVPPTNSVQGEIVDHTFKEGSSGLFGLDLPEKWIGELATKIKYFFIFTEYKLFGDNSPFLKLKIGRRLQKYLIRKMKRPVPGWYDTHTRIK
jgi:FkbM family methyltransferase